MKTSALRFSLTEGIAAGREFIPSWYADPTIGHRLAACARHHGYAIARDAWPSLFEATPRDSWLFDYGPDRLGVAIANAEYSGIDEARILAEIERIETAQFNARKEG